MKLPHALLPGINDGVGSVKAQPSAPKLTQFFAKCFKGGTSGNVFNESPQLKPMTPISKQISRTWSRNWPSGHVPRSHACWRTTLLDLASFIHTLPSTFVRLLVACLHANQAVPAQKQFAVCFLQSHEMTLHESKRRFPHARAHMKGATHVCFIHPHTPPNFSM